MPPVVYPIQFADPSLDAFSLFNIAAATCVSIWLMFSYVANPWRLTRPAFAFALLVNLIFQWPLVFLASPIYNSLNDPWWFVSCAHVVGISGLMWVWATDKITIAPDIVAKRLFSWRDVSVILGMTVVFSGLYFINMPMHCTALYALLFDPAYTLIAREVTVKLSGSTLASSSYGALANTLAPVLAAVSVAQIFRFSLERSIYVLLWATCLLGSIVVVMVAGAKGLTIPLVGAVCVSAVYWSVGWARKILAGSTALICVVCALASFELLRERGGGSSPYQFVSCVQTLGTFEKGAELLGSISRTGGLGLTPGQVERLMVQLEADSGLRQDRNFTPPKAPNADRAATYVGALLQRAFISPIQVAAWHHLYIQDEGAPGLLAMPLAKKLFGSSIDMSSIVYMKYGVIYSSGDRTSTSTAPTSFIFSWPAYFGYLGLAAAVVALLALDLVVSMLARRISQNLLPITAAIAVVISFNMITSDIVVVMLSHGGGIAIVLLAAFGAVRALQGTLRPAAM